MSEVTNTKKDEMPTRMFRMKMEIGIVAILAGAIGTAVGIARKFADHQHVMTMVVLVPSVLLIIGVGVFFILWKRPPQNSLDKIAQNIEKRLQQGKEVKILPRAFLIIVFMFALAGAAMMLFLI